MGANEFPVNYFSMSEVEQWFPDFADFLGKVSTVATETYFTGNAAQRRTQWCCLLTFSKQNSNRTVTEQ
eukprot:1568594-Pyramimonas_sp.AAC.1